MTDFNGEMLTFKEVLKEVQLPAETVLTLLRERRFPAPVKLINQGAAWPRYALQDWNGLAAAAGVMHTGVRSR